MVPAALGSTSDSALSAYPSKTKFRLCLGETVVMDVGEGDGNHTF